MTDREPVPQPTLVGSVEWAITGRFVYAWPDMV